MHESAKERKRAQISRTGKRKTYTSTSSPPFLKRPCKRNLQGGRVQQGVWRGSPHRKKDGISFKRNGGEKWVRVGPVEVVLEYLGGHFGPEKKYLAPPPSPQTFPRRPSPSRTSSSETPPPSLCFLQQTGAHGHLLGLLLPLTRPGTEKNKKYPKRPPRY